MGTFSCTHVLNLIVKTCWETAALRSSGNSFQSSTVRGIKLFLAVPVSRFLASFRMFALTRSTSCLVNISSRLVSNVVVDLDWLLVRLDLEQEDQAVELDQLLHTQPAALEQPSFCRCSPWKFSNATGSLVL